MAYQPSVKYKDFEDFLKKSGYTDSIRKLGEYSDAALLGSISDLEAQKKAAAASSSELARNAYIKYANARAALPEQLGHSGYSGGMADTLKVSLENEYQNAYNKIIRDRYKALGDIEKQKAEIKNKADSDRAEELYKLYLAAADSYNSSVKDSESRAYDEYITKLKASKELEKLYAQSALEEQEKALAREKESSAEALKFALAAAEYGDYTYLKDLGITPSGALTVSDSSSSGSGSSSSGSGKTSSGSGKSSSGSGSSSSGTGVTLNEDGTYQSLTRGINVAEKMAKYGSYSLLAELTGVDADIIREIYEKQAVEEEKKNEQEVVKEETDPLSFDIPDIKGFAEAIRLFMKGSTNESVLKVIRQAYPTYTYQEVFTIWRKTAMEKLGITPAKSYTGPERTFREDTNSMADVEPHARLKSLFNND